LTRRGPEALGLAAAILAALAGVALAVGTRSAPDVVGRRVGAQRALGGLGLGPAAGLDAGPEFDARAAPERATGPVPAVGPAFPLPAPSLLPPP